MAVKSNQKGLGEDIEAFFQQPPAAYTVDEHEIVEKDHGRIESREYRVCNEMEWLRERHDWAGLVSIVEIRSIAVKQGRFRESYRYYIGSLCLTAKATAYAIRSHWGVENQLHWVLDCCLKRTARALGGVMGPTIWPLFVI
ncbi:ISAs1 family transposase [Solemya velesiana gill symbiont]|uniref:Transposase IS4-like domain-containing protein n=1 Tax=Solemya velesiana gill symbiont TaxID=1918948 RepID=A0A1T2KSY3_9GAMM|nr:hypothetical protein BOW51_10055 [Solemya velesiana gill symbiont]